MRLRGQGTGLRHASFPWRGFESHHCKCVFYSGPFDCDSGPLLKIQIYSSVPFKLLHSPF